MSKPIPALDGVRGLAVLLVIGFHARLVFTTTSEIPFAAFQLLSLGWSGVDLFFVLSGFLITGILLDTRASPSYFRVFYARRVLRIFPLYFFYLFLILVVSRLVWLWYSGHDLWASVQPWTYVTYLMNWKADHGYADRYLDHLWSLAIEEQFYLVWPAAVWLIPRRGLPWFCLALCAAGLAARFFLGRLSAFSPEDIYRMTPSHLDSLAVGALVALGIRDFRSIVEQWKPLVVAICITGFVYVFAISPGQIWSDAPMRTVGVTLLAFLYGSVVFQAATAESGYVVNLFRNSLLRRFGKYSYGMYVYHSALWQLSFGPVRDLSSSPLPRVIVLSLKYLYPPLLIGASFAVAWLSWKFLEQPFLLLKDRFPYEEGYGAAGSERLVNPLKARLKGTQ